MTVVCLPDILREEKDGYKKDRQKFSEKKKKDIKRQTEFLKEEKEGYKKIDRSFQRRKRRI